MGKSLAKLYRKSEAKFIESIKDLKIKSTQSGVLTCKVSPDNTEVQWYRGNAVLSNDDKCEITSLGESRSLEIKNFSEKDCEDYFVKIIENEDYFCSNRIRIAKIVMEN